MTYPLPAPPPHTHTLWFTPFWASDSGQHELFRDAVKTSESHNFESRACWSLKRESVSGVAARAREHWKPSGVRVSGLGQSPEVCHSCLHIQLAWVCTCSRARALRLDACGLSRLGEGRDKPGSCVGGTEFILFFFFHTLLKGGSQSSAPANHHPEKILPVLPDLSNFHERSEGGSLKN